MLNSKLYVLYGLVVSRKYWYLQNAELHCFDPVKNAWEVKAQTCTRHYGSSLFFVNNRMYVAGGYNSIRPDGSLHGNPGQVEVYDDVKNTWSVVEQRHIPPNNRNAVEIEGKVYFMINKFPVDIPPGELYPVHLGEWENLGKISTTSVLCYLPVKRESLNSE